VIRQAVHAAAFLACAWAVPALAQSQLVVSAGPENSTAWIAANDLQDVGRSCGVQIEVASSEGAITSLEALDGPIAADAAILQGDVLDYLQSYRGQDPKIAAAIEGVEMAAPLFSQEFHVVARPGIDSLDDLNGARVNLGPLTSGGFLTATIALDFLGISPGERLRMPTETAIDALKSGDLDAVLIVDAVPSRLLQNSGLTSDQAQLLDVVDPFLSETYQDASIPGGTYAFEPETRKSIAVKSYLMTRASASQGPACVNVADTVAMISRRRDLLATRGHQKWGELDMVNDLLNWPVSSCAVVGLDPARPLTCQ